jgi:hypothetical protein
MIKLNNLLNEVALDKIFHLDGVLVVDSTARNQKDMLSDIRALPGITVVRNIEMEQDPTSRYFRSKLEMKIDPYPYVKQNKFNGEETIQIIANNIKKVPGVIGFKQDGAITTSEV